MNPVGGRYGEIALEYFSKFINFFKSIDGVLELMFWYNKFFPSVVGMLDHRILECYENYLHQVFLQMTGGVGAEEDGPRVLLREACKRNPEMAQRVIQFFKSKFLPESGDVHSDFQWEIQGLEEQDKLGFLPVVSAIEKTVRTNFYCPDAGALVIKIIQDNGVTEIFMDHPVFQGVLLKGAMIARGGLRWSDREDFRSECWQLMETQVLKNSIIVPSGAKGAFLLKPIGAEPLQAYTLFVQGLLDVSDNLEHGKAVHPPHVRCYDGDDFYNVVAADKGTAHFSDHGNAIAVSRGYWLGDAFASGGSNGYNHKKLAITSRGTWVSVRHHLARLGYGRDQPLRVIGVGDMAGDVFGNGMLEDSNIQLLAAFNHEAIFIDPNPDPQVSYRERCRLFHLPRSRWSDYTALSQGGAVFSRSQEQIELSHEARALLGVDQVVWTPNDLIREILKMRADLLWLGGIGTFVQGESEQSVPDSANRAIRVFGKQVRAKVVGEGANLGMTQAGRIEYALNAGSLNTDAIDNCAGVNCSDHEINIKILLDEVLRRGDISDQERSQILQSVTNDVCDHVLKENMWQNLALTLACQDSLGAGVGGVLDFLTQINHGKPQDPAVAILRQGIEDRSAQGVSITRPEMAVVLSLAKKELKKVLGHMDLSNIGNEDVIQYFPRMVQERFSDFLGHHLLYNSIKITMLTNRLLDMVGPIHLTLWAKKWSVAMPDLVHALLELDSAMDGYRMMQKVDGSIENLAQAEQWIRLYQDAMCSGLQQWFSHGPMREKASLKISTGLVEPEFLDPYQQALAVVTI